MFLSRYISNQGAAFERVCMAFRQYGFAAPNPDTPGEGAYVSNILDQYPNNRQEALALIRYGLEKTRAMLQDEPYWSLPDIVGRYAD